VHIICLFQGYGGGTGEDKRPSVNAANLTMIRRFNHHSTMVLKACEKAGSQLSSKAPNETSAASPNGSLNNSRVNGIPSATENGYQPTPKRVNLLSNYLEQNRIFILCLIIYNLSQLQKNMYNKVHTVQINNYSLKEIKFTIVLE